MDVVLIGAGGHAKAVVEILRVRGDRILAYVDPQPCDWLKIRHVRSDEGFDDLSAQVVLGLGATEPERLQRRLGLLRAWMSRGFSVSSVVHPSAIVSSSARLEDGVTVLASVVVQPNASIGSGAIVNTGAIIEHDSTIGAGAHVAPGAIVLGGVEIGDCAMIGAAAVVLPQATVAPRSLVKAQECFGRSKLS